MKTTLTLLALLATAALCSAKGDLYSLETKLQVAGETLCTPKVTTKVNTPTACTSSVFDPNLPKYAQETGIWIVATPLQNKKGEVTWSLHITERHLVPGKSEFPVVSTKSWETQIKQEKPSQTRTVKEQGSKVTFTTEKLKNP